MIATQLARIIAEFAIFLEFSSPEFVDPDAASKMKSVLQRGVSEMDSAFRGDLAQGFALVAGDFTATYQSFVRNLPSYLRLDQANPDNTGTTRVIQIARVIAEMSLFLDLTDDTTVDPDNAVEMLESLGVHLDELDKDFLRELVDAFAVVALEYRGEAQKLVRDIPHDFFLEETLVEDEPERLAELDALRDARPVEISEEGRPNRWHSNLRIDRGDTPAG